MSKCRLAEAWTDWLSTGGIFTQLAALQGVDPLPWSADPLQLDLDYYGNNSGDKQIAPLLEKMMKADGGELTAARKAQLAGLIYSKYSGNWSKRWEALQSEYDPLENYSMSETEAEDTTNTGTVGNVSSVTGSGSRNVTGSSDVELDRDVYGYDSSTPTPSEGETTQTSSSEAVTTTDSNSGTSTRTDNLAGTRDRTLTRSGNIGVTTSQQMLQAELDIRTYDFYKSVYDDIDHVLTTPVY